MPLASRFNGLTGVAVFMPLALFVTAACSSSSGSSPNASIDVAFKDRSYHLVTGVVARSTSDRWLVQIDESNTKVFISLTLPVSEREYDIAQGTDATVWAQDSRLVTPIIASAGMVSLTAEHSKYSISLAGLNGAADLDADRVNISGAVWGVAAE